MAGIQKNPMPPEQIQCGTWSNIWWAQRWTNRRASPMSTGVPSNNWTDTDSHLRVSIKMNSLSVYFCICLVGINHTKMWTYFVQDCKEWQYILSDSHQRWVEADCSQYRSFRSSMWWSQSVRLLLQPSKPSSTEHKQIDQMTMYQRHCGGKMVSWEA